MRSGEEKGCWMTTPSTVLALGIHCKEMVVEAEEGTGQIAGDCCSVERDPWYGESKGTIVEYQKLYVDDSI